MIFLQIQKENEQGIKGVVSFKSSSKLTFLVISEKKVERKIVSSMLRVL